MVRSDALGDVLNPLDGRRYDSKSEYYRTVKNAGCEILGNETIKPRDNHDDAELEKQIQSEVAQAFNSLG